MKNGKPLLLRAIGLALFVSLLTGQAIPAQNKSHTRPASSLAGVAPTARPRQADDSAPVTDDDRWDDGFGFSKSQTSVDYYDKVKAIAVSGKDLYVGGRFEEAGGVKAEGIAKWNGEHWLDLSGGVNDCHAYSCYPTVNSLSVQGADLIAGGNFVHIGGVETNKVARWDGHQWSALGKGVVICHQNDCVTVDSVAVGANNIYAVGVIDTDVVGVGANMNAQGVTQWDGQGWATLGGGVAGEIVSLNAVAASGSDAYIGGHFQNAGGTSVNNIARWDGQAWQPLGDGITRPGTCTGHYDINCWSYVFSIATAGTDVYVGGWFSRAGEATANNIARWDGQHWSPLGTGANDTVYAVAVHGKEVYAGGDFTEIGGVKADHIAKWDGEKWSAIGSGVDGRVFAIACRDNEVFVGGKFTKAGGKPAFNFARWVGPVVAPPPPPVLLPQISSVSVRRKLLTVTGTRFDEGAKILLNGEGQKTANDAEQPTTVLVAKKSGKKVKPGDRLQVQNRDGKLSPDFIVTP